MLIITYKTVKVTIFFEKIYTKYIKIFILLFRRGFVGDYNVHFHLFTCALHGFKHSVHGGFADGYRLRQDKLIGKSL